jgi:acetyl esterase
VSYRGAAHRLAQRPARESVLSWFLRSRPTTIVDLRWKETVVSKPVLEPAAQEAYARRLTQAGVPTTSVRYNGIIHDFMMLNPVRKTQAATAAIEQAVRTLRGALGTG